MTRARPGLARLAAVAWMALGPHPAAAHDVPRRNVVNAFLKIDVRQATLVVRVPLEIVASARFPAKGRELDLAGAGPATERALAGLAHDLAIWEEGARLTPSSATGRLSLPSDRSFRQYDEAIAHVQGAVDRETVIYYDQGFLDAQLTFPIASAASRFEIQTMLAPELRDYVKLAIRVLPLGEEGRALWITSRSGRVDVNPSWYRAGASFAMLGVTHILSGLDHLLFLLCVVVPLLRLRQVLWTVTAFTVAHSFTLLGSAFGLAPAGAWFPPFVETAIAASIVYLALENIVGAAPRRRWLVTGAFGLVHGFGFSYALQENLQFAGRHLLVSLFSFNAGIEIGQVAALAVAWPLLAVLRRRVLAGRTGVILLSAIVANLGWDWMMERGKVLRSVEWPRLDAAALSTLAAWAAGLLLAAGAVRVAPRLAGRARAAVSGGQARSAGP